jgi:hypothetical protein
VRPSLTVSQPTKVYNTTRRTKLIDDAKRPQPRFRGLVHGTVSIVREEGLRGIYRGLFPVVRPVVRFLDSGLRARMFTERSRR